MAERAVRRKGDHHPWVQPIPAHGAAAMFASERLTGGERMDWTAPGFNSEPLRVALSSRWIPVVAVRRSSFEPLQIMHVEPTFPAAWAASVLPLAAASQARRALYPVPNAQRSLDEAAAGLASCPLMVTFRTHFHEVVRYVALHAYGTRLLQLSSDSCRTVSRKVRIFQDAMTRSSDARVSTTKLRVVKSSEEQI